MANWYDETVTVKEVKETVETRPTSKNFYDVINAIRDEEIQARIDFYVSCMNEYSEPLTDMGFPEKGDYSGHNMFINLPYGLTSYEWDKHFKRFDELEEIWQEEVCSKERDYDDYEERYKEAVDNAYRYSDGAFSFECRLKLHGKSFTSQYYTEEYHPMKENADGSIEFAYVTETGENRGVHVTKEKKITWFKRRYKIRDGSRSDQIELPSYIKRTRGPLYGARFGYSERESIFNEPSVKFNKKGEPMATSKTKEVLKTILTKNNATAIKAPKKAAKTTDARLKNIEGLRKSWEDQIAKMKTDFHTFGKAKGIEYVPNDKKVEDSYYTVEFVSKRKHLMLEAGKPIIKLQTGNKDKVTGFLQDIVDAISTHVFDAQLLTHQRNVAKAKKAAAEKKEEKAAAK